MNPLDNYPNVRKALYLIQWLINGVTGVLGIIFTAQGESPAWYVLTVACLAFLWTYAGITAQGNVTQDPSPIRDERGSISLGGDPDPEPTPEPEPKDPEPTDPDEPQRRPYEESH